MFILEIEHIEIPEWDAPSWETYKAVRHCAIIHGNEIHFFIVEKTIGLRIPTMEYIT